MEYAQIPTNLLIGDYSDAEILSIVKYQLLYSSLENIPTSKILNRFLTKKQQNLVKIYVADINSWVQKDIEKVNKKRDRNGRYYQKTKVSEVSQEKIKTSYKPSDSRPNKLINKEDIVIKTSDKTTYNEILSAHKKVYEYELATDDKINAVISYWIKKDEKITSHIEDVFLYFKNHYRFKNADKTKPSKKWLFADKNNYFEVLDEYKTENVSPYENPLADEMKRYLEEE